MKFHFAALDKIQFKKEEKILINEIGNNVNFTRDLSSSL